MPQPFTPSTSGQDVDIVACYSQRYQSGQRHYSASIKECCEVVLTIPPCLSFLFEKKLTVFTDHRALVCIYHMQDTSNMLTRWAIALQNFGFTVKHVAGKPNIVPDTLSRLLRNINKKLVSNDPALASICRNAPNDRPYHRAGPRDFEISARSLEQSELVQNDRESFASAVSVFLLIKRTPSSGTERGVWGGILFFLRSHSSLEHCVFHHIVPLRQVLQQASNTDSTH